MGLQAPAPCNCPVCLQAHDDSPVFSNVKAPSSATLRVPSSDYDTTRTDDQGRDETPFVSAPISGSSHGKTQSYHDALDAYPSGVNDLNTNGLHRTADGTADSQQLPAASSPPPAPVALVGNLRPRAAQLVEDAPGIKLEEKQSPQCIDKIRSMQPRHLVHNYCSYYNAGEQRYLHAVLAAALQQRLASPSRGGMTWTTATVRGGSDASSRGCVVIDIGANLGQYSTLAMETLSELGLHNCHVIAYEASPATHTQMLATMAKEPVLASFRGTWTPVNKGLGDKPGQLPFYSNKVGDEGASFNRRGSLSHKALVDVVTMDDEVERRVAPGQDILFLKMDVETYEWPVLKGMRRLLASKRVPAIQWERNGHNPEQFKHTWKDEVDYVASFGYRVFAIGGGDRTATRLGSAGEGRLLRLDGPYFSKALEKVWACERITLNNLAILEGHPVLQSKEFLDGLLCDHTCSKCRDPQASSCEPTPERVLDRWSEKMWNAHKKKKCVQYV
eukprot:jgi/Mesvir1/24613/Mv21929-RA.2